MSTKQIFIRTVLVAMTLLTSCQKNELLYSCDPKINDWVIKTKSVYADISRDELAKLNLSLGEQKGLFLSFSPEQKTKIYQSKYQYLMGLNTFSEMDKEYLTVLFKRITPDIYSSKEERIKFVGFSEEWTYEVVDKLGWDFVDVYRYTHTWLTNEEFDRWVELQRTTLKSTNAEVPCECYWDISCIWSFNPCRKSSGCKVTDGGCGIAGNTDCTGTCL
ncbi:MAG: bacteriocin fulvocin C-related protein [Bacteroidales bacterium]|nr:bacteriocin fulvocin C-related protein [Bacteroidales bacterium]